MASQYSSKYRGKQFQNINPKRKLPDSSDFTDKRTGNGVSESEMSINSFISQKYGVYVVDDDRDLKHQRLRYDLIEIQPLTSRSPSPQLNPTLVSETDGFRVFEDEYHVFYHEISPEDVQATFKDEKLAYNHQLNHQTCYPYGNLLSPSSQSDARGSSDDGYHGCSMIGPQVISLSFTPDIGFSSSNEYCKYCDAEHSSRGCGVLRNAEANAISSGQDVDSISKTSHSSSFDYDIDNEHKAHTTQEDWQAQFRFPRSFDEEIRGQFQLTVGQKVFNDYLYKAQGIAPQIQAPQPVRLSLETVESRLLANHCKHCGAKCCEPNGIFDCRVLYKGEECQKCKHQGCLDWLETLGKKGTYSVARGETGLINGGLVCKTCGGQNCGDLIPTSCSKC